MTSLGLFGLPVLAALPCGDVTTHVGAQDGGPVGAVRLARLTELSPETHGGPQLVERRVRHDVLRGSRFPSVEVLTVATYGVLDCGHRERR